VGYELNEKNSETVRRRCLTAINHLTQALGYQLNGKKEPRNSAVIAAYYELEQMITEPVEDSENYTGEVRASSD